MFSIERLVYFMKIQFIACSVPNDLVTMIATKMERTCNKKTVESLLLIVCSAPVKLCF